VASYYAADSLIGWSGYHSGIALGLIGQETEAERRLLAVTAHADGNPIGWLAALGAKARAMANLVHDAAGFRNAVQSDLAKKREALRLYPTEIQLSGP